MNIRSLLAIVLLLFYCGSSELLAGSSNKNGNPFGNGSFFNTSGTFNGVVRGANIVGITVFSTGTNTTLNGGPFYIYDANRGVYDDTLGVYAILDPSVSSLNATIFPSANTAYSANLSYGGGSFSAALTVNPPNQTFSGTGNLTELDDSTGVVVTTNIPFSINGCRISN